MSPKLRLSLCVLVILGSASYAVLIAQDPTIASAVAVGYVAILFTIFFVVNIWKKP